MKFRYIIGIIFQNSVLSDGAGGAAGRRGGGELGGGGWGVEGKRRRETQRNDAEFSNCLISCRNNVEKNIKRKAIIIRPDALTINGKKAVKRFQEDYERAEFPTEKGQLADRVFVRLAAYL
jgi:hypothetical protein